MNQTNRTTALEWTAARGRVGVGAKINVTGQILTLDSAVIKHKLCLARVDAS